MAKTQTAPAPDPKIQGFENPGLDDLLTKNSKSITDSVIEENNNPSKDTVEDKTTDADTSKQNGQDNIKEGDPVIKEEKQEEAKEDSKEQEQKQDKPAQGNDHDWFMPSSESKPADPSTTQVKEESNYSDIVSLIESHGELKAIIDIIKADPSKSIFQITSEIQGEDAGKMSVADLIKWKGKKLGLEEADINKEIDNYDSLKESSPLQSKTFENQLRSERADEQRQALAKVAGDTAKSSREAQQRQKVINDRLNSELASAVNEIPGKRFFGLDMTKDDAKDFEKWVMEDYSISRADGSYDINKLRLFWLAEKKMKFIETVNKSDGKAEGNIEVLKDVSRVNLNNEPKGNLPVPTPPKDPKEIAKGAQEMVKEAYSGIGS